MANTGGQPIQEAGGMMTAQTILKSLSGSRWDICWYLFKRGPHSVEGIAAGLDMSQSSVSHHLAKLRKVGLVKTKTVKKNVIYRLANSADFAVLVEAVMRLDKEWI